MDADKKEDEFTANPCCTEKLPLLVMMKIFKLLSTSDRESAMRVCVRWHDIIKYEVGLTVFVGNRHVYNVPGHKSVKWRSIGVLSKMGIDKCLFAEMTGAETCDYDGVDGHFGQGFLLPELVTDLSFYGKITSDLFRTIVTPVYWLTTLKLHLTVFRLVSFDDFTLKLCSLAQLRIFYTHPVFHLNFPFNEEDITAKKFIHENLINFLSTCFFLRIKIFEFVGPYFVDETKNLIDAVRTFVVRHAVTLKELVLSFPYEWNVEGTRKARETEISNKIYSSSSSELEHLQRQHDWGNVNLRRLHVVCPATIVPPIQATSTLREAVSSWSQQSLNSLWEALLEKQCQMTSLQYVNKYADWAFPHAMILNNANTLRVICLNVNSHFHVDCKILACCTNLKKLNLEGNYFHDQNHRFQDNQENNVAARLMHHDDVDGISRLFNANHLPKSLQEICLSKIMIPVSEVDVLVDATEAEAKRFPNLRSLQLYQICKGFPEFGLTTLAVQHLFDQSNLSVSFWQALNCTSFQGALSKALSKVIDQEVMTLTKVLEHCDTDEDEDGAHDVNLRFETLYDCHVQLIRKSVQTK